MSVLENFRERRNGARRRRERDRPAARIAIEPRGLHARLPRAHHVGDRIVADVQDLGRGNARHVAQCLEDARIGLGGARNDRAPETSVRIGERDSFDFRASDAPAAACAGRLARARMTLLVS